MTTQAHLVPPRLAGLALLVALGSTACIAVIEGTDSESSGPGGSYPSGTNKPTNGVDPGRKGPHRLSNVEYNNTVGHLLGTALAPASTFLAETDHGFDNIASALGMTAPQYEGYYNAAAAIAEDVFATPALRAGIVSCEPASPGDTACATTIIQEFGLKAFRRPLTPEEVARFVQVYSEALGLQEDHAGALRNVVTAFLASAEFLYRIEFDPKPDSAEPHFVDDYAMASRLSYFGWGSMPDAELFDLAKNGRLIDPAVLVQQVDRLLSDVKSKNFVTSFGGQWLGMRQLNEHSVLPEIFPTWNDQLRSSMNEEAHQYFATFLYQDGPWTEFLTSDFNFLDAPLASHYGLPAPSTPFAGVNVLDDHRRGFLGLGMFLTMSSYAHRTSVPLRAKWLLENLLCDPPPDPPPDLDIGSLDGDAANEAASLLNVRARLELHRTDPKCARCHDVLDPIGFALEQFDAIGQYRETYGNGDVIDPSGQMPDGTTYNGLEELSAGINADPRFMECTVEKMFNFALGRGVTAEDDPYVLQILEHWQSGAPTLRDLMKHVVSNDTFRLRRGEQ